LIVANPISSQGLLPLCKGNNPETVGRSTFRRRAEAGSMKKEALALINIINIDSLCEILRTRILGKIFNLPARVIRERLSRTIAVSAAVGLLFAAGQLRAGVCYQPPIPLAGETVSWMAANSPFQIYSELTIPQGGTVIVEPGVELHFQEHTLTVSRVLKAQGQAASHITITATSNFPPAITLQGGNVTMSFSDVTGQIRGTRQLTVSDSTFTGPKASHWEVNPSRIPLFVHCIVSGLG
jgi:hypothetical protein